jgi:hydroxyacylglutathione hydrolase
VTHPVAEGDTIELGGSVQFQVLDTPGHTRGHVCYVGEGALFCGDTLFTGGCGRLFEGTAEQMYHSLEKLRSLADETLVYCAHEYTEGCLRFAVVAEPDNEDIRTRQVQVGREREAGKATVPAPLGVEKRTNPFLRSHEPALIAGAERFAGHPLTTSIQVFATVRGWKDSLD